MEGNYIFSGFHHQYWKAHTVFFFPVLTPLPTHSLLAASPCSYLWNEKKENKSTASCWTKTCSFPRICVTIVDGENGLLLKERKCSASYFQKQSTTCINVFISTKNTSAREPNKRVFTVCLGSALNLFCLSCLFLLRPPSLSLSPSTPSSLANKSESEGWINKGGKVEHNSPRSVFSGTLTQRKGSTRTNDNTIYIKTLTHINVRPVWL